MSECGPVALRILDQLVRLADQDGAAAALQPVVVDDAGDLAPLPLPRCRRPEPAATERTAC